MSQAVNINNKLVSLDHLDFNHDLACETIDRPCEPRNRAVWRVVPQPCCEANIGKVILMCDVCLQDRLNSFGVECYCGTRYRPPHMAYKLIEAI